MPNVEYFASRQKTLTKVIIALSVLIPVVVGLLLFTAALGAATGINLHYLPTFHAILSAITTVLLVMAFIFIRQKKIVAHKTTMLFALLCSALFLASYVTYHSLAEATTFGGEGWVRYIYYTLLISHIILAAIIVPLVLFTFLIALGDRIANQRKIARWT
jgi:putative membrane protein